MVPILAGTVSTHKQCAQHCVRCLWEFAGKRIKLMIKIKCGFLAIYQKQIHMAKYNYKGKEQAIPILLQAIFSSLVRGLVSFL